MTMMALKIEDIKLLTIQAQLHQLTTSLLANKNQLDIWQDLVDEYRSLQMDDMIDEEDDDINGSIDLIEGYIDQTRIIMHDIMDRINEFNTKIISFSTKTR